MYAVVAADQASGLFAGRRAFLQDGIAQVFARGLARHQCQALVNGAITVQPDGRLKAEFRPPDVRQRRWRGCSTGRSARTGAGSRIIADAILTDHRRDGYFDTRIVMSRKRPGDSASAIGDHGPGRRQSPLPDGRRLLC
jgi:hypothetical protein